MENRIKEQQIGLFADRTNTHTLCGHPAWPVLVIFDQAEQVLQSTASGTHVHADARSTLRGLVALATAPGLDVRVLCVLRADWLPQALAAPELDDAWHISSSQVTLAGLAVATLRDVILLPADRKSVV